MKKFYVLVAATVLFMFITSAVQAQYTSFYDTQPDDGSQHLVSDVTTWVGGVLPPNPCHACLITVHDQLLYTTTSGALTLDDSKLVIDGGASIEMDEYINLNNTIVVVGNDASTPATAIVNDQVFMFGTSSIQLANQNVSINTNNGSGNPVNGGLADYGTGTVVAGIYYFTGADPQGYYIVLNQLGYGNSAGTVGGNDYALNCGGASPNPCQSGVVYGPAITQENATSNFYGFAQSTVLPVDLVQFVATKNDDQTVRVAWSTAQEINSSYYDVERSSDLAVWEKLGSVNAKGFSSTTVNYSFTDVAPLTGTGYYRLKMVDLDAKFKYSKVVSVSSDNSTVPLVVYNNPFNDQIRVKVNIPQSDILVLTVTDLLGKSYIRQNFNAQAGDNFINLIPSTTGSGIYILHIRGNSYDKTVKLIKQ